jgi:glycosyltransferase involved in cell wall biosynthesis
MIKVLWLSNRLFESEADNRSGTWLKALGPELAKCGKLELANISFGPVNQLTSCDFGKIKQWALPYPTTVGKLPPKKIVIQLQNVISTFQPDIIQIWGVEQYWGLLHVNGLLGTDKIVLNVQGIMRSIAAVYDGNMSFREKWAYTGLRELRYPASTLYAQKRLFETLSVIEEKIIRSVKFVAVQSDWSAGQVNAINPKALILRSNRALRPEFYNSECRESRNFNFRDGQLRLFTTCFGNPYKGFHIALKALDILRKSYPKIKLRVSAQMNSSNWKRGAYEKYIVDFIRINKLQNHIEWLGALNANQLIQEFQESSCYIHPSFVESFSLSTAEALAVGTPTVCSFAGALPEMNGELDNILFFSPGDYVQLANCINKFLQSTNLMEVYSKRGHSFIMGRCDKELIIEEQIKQYSIVLKE